MIIVNKIEIVTTQDEFLFYILKKCIIEGTCISYETNSTESFRVSGLYFNKSHKDTFFEFFLPSDKKNLRYISFEFEI